MNAQAPLYPVGAPAALPEPAIRCRIVRTVRIERAETAGEEWDAFVARSPRAALGHAAAWLVVCREAYALATHALTAREPSGEIAGVLPLVESPRLAGGIDLVSMPYLDTGGVLARSIEAERALLGAAFDLARERRAAAVELRSLHALESVGPAEFAERIDLALPLQSDSDAQWRALPATVRNQCRKAERAGLRLSDAGQEQLCLGFYDPFCINMRDLGSPVHGLRFFRAMADAFGERMRFVVSADGEQSVGGLIAIDYAGVVTIPWASTLRAERPRCPNNQIYWEAIRWAIERGARELDFGRSPRDSGTHRFKRGWGAEERPLAWTRFGASGAVEPVASPGSSRALHALSRVWQRLPLRWTRRLGPPIRRRISS